MNKKILIIGIALLLVATVTAISIFFVFPYLPNQAPKADESGSTQQGIQKVVDANNKFAFDLYSEFTKTEKGNIFYSPYSISAALAMTYEGAKGQTADEIKSVFDFPGNSALRPNFAAIYNNINKKNKPYKLNTGNALWAQQDYKFLDQYISAVENYYGGKAANLDFIKESEKSRQTINAFIEEQTNNRIKDLIPTGVLDSMTRLVITNAIYFKGSWELEFDKSDTREQDFKVTQSEIVKTQMMHMNPEKARFNYAELENLQILELPYKGGEISVLILLPKQGEEYYPETEKTIVSDYTLEDIDLSLEKLNEYKSQMSETGLSAIYLPKFEFDTKYFMKETLSSLGMPTAFLGNADFSGMDGTKTLFISEVIHQAFVKVDEEGTQAAAATAVIMTKSSAGPSQRKIFRADHPFIFIIQEKNTGNILFIGRVTDPNKKI
ncbi:MAG: serpin family protein [archaeon]